MFIRVSLIIEIIEKNPLEESSWGLFSIHPLGFFPVFQQILLVKPL